MAPPKKNTVKLDLNTFLNDDTFGSKSWAEEDVDLNKISIPIENVPANTVPLEEIAAAARNQSGRGGSRLDPALAGSSSGGRRDFQEREEYPVPEHPPFRAIINNIPWDISPEGVKAWVQDGLNNQEAVEDIDLPVSMKDPSRLKGLAFVTLKERSDLVKALTFNGTKLNERTVYVSVAAPRRDGYRSGGGDFDWGAARGSNYEASADRNGPELEWGAARGANFQASRPRRDDGPDLEWGAARGSNFQASRPPREEPNLDWDAVRGSNFQASRPPREEPNLDWDAVRGSNFKASSSRPPREEANLDWDGARGSNFKAQQSQRKPRNNDEPELDWGAARGSNFGKKTTSNTQKTTTSRFNRTEKTAEATTEAPKVQKSAFDVLRTEDDDEEEEEEQEPVKEEKNNTSDVNQLAKETANLNVADDSEWEVVGKK